MKKLNINYLKELVEIPSPSGFECNMTNYIIDFIETSKIKCKTDVDSRNNLVVTLSGENSYKTLMLDAHIDQLGYIVHYIDKTGYIYVQPIGGHSDFLTKGRRVEFINDNEEIIEGVTGVKPAHLSDGEEDLSNLYIDIGLRKKSDVLKKVQIGNVMYFKPEFYPLNGNCYAGSGMDDKAGVFLLLNILCNLNNKKLPNDVKFSFSSQEEIGCFGSREVARRYKPNLFIGVDVTFATDCPEVEEKEVGSCSLDNGLLIYKGVSINREGVKTLFKISKKEKIKIQYGVMGGYAGTNAGFVAHVSDGIDILDVGIPCRYLHSPIEVININDVYSGAKLLTEFCKKGI